MVKIFTQKLKQVSLALFLIVAGLMFSGKAKACSSNFMYNATHLSVTFTDSGSSALSHAHSVHWSFGDSTYASTDNPSHTYSHNGTYYVCVTLYDSSTSCSSTHCQYISVNNCTLVASYTYTASGRTAHFTNTTSTSGTTTYIWHFGDGSVDSTSGDTVSHTYSGSDNNYSTSLTVYEHGSGCSATSYVYIALCKASARFNTSISGHGVTLHADSSNTSGVTYSWSFGDGGSSTSQNVTHTYSAVGSYTVCLTATDSATSCTSVHCETVTVTEPTYCIYGNITMSSGNVAPAMVYLISFNASDSSLTALDSFIVRDSMTSYHFCSRGNGTYYTKAALLSTNSSYSSYIPTYHSGATNWASASAITISGADVTGADIAMVSGTNPGGPGFIGGLISAGANKVGDPEVGILVILYNSKNVPVAYTHSGKDGKYSFSNLAYGTYAISADIPGKKSYPVSVTIDESHKSVSTVDISVHAKYITGEVNAGIDNAAVVVDNALVYPNPVIDKLVINTNLQASQRVNILISDITGKIIASYNKDIASGLQTLELDANPLNNGMYFVKILLPKDNKILEARFVKAQ